MFQFNWFKGNGIQPHLFFEFLNYKKFTWLYILIALSLLLHGVFIHFPQLLVEEAYYWNYAAHLDIGYIDHPPMVALVIKLSTWLWGNNEFGVRFPAWVSWAITFFYTYHLAEDVHHGSGRFACLLISILPICFIYSFFITPDSLLMACWAALLFYLYQALCLEKPQAWYKAGLFLGLGLLAKYTIILLAGAAFIYMLALPQARRWFMRKEPYLAALISIVCFSPVIYWNATHEWVSFIFQSTRRIQSHTQTNLPVFLAYMVVFFTPVGLLGLVQLWRNKTNSILALPTRRFIQLFTGFPLLIFGFFSITHTIKFNWIGPAVLATVPWLAILMQNHLNIRRAWRNMAFVALAVYSLLLFCISFSLPNIISLTFFKRYTNWEYFTHDIAGIVRHYAHDEKKFYIMPLDSYAIASELTFYQPQLTQKFPVLGAHFFGYNSLMYDMWTKNYDLHGNKVLLIARSPAMLATSDLMARTKALSQIQPLWTYNTRAKKLLPFYYKIVEIL